MKSWKVLLLGIALAALAPSYASAQTCADLNNDGGVTVGDAIALSQCVASSCPPNVCGNGNPLTCADLLEDGVITNADLAVIVDSLAGIETLFPLCEGPGTTLAGCPGTVTLNSGNISTNTIWPAGCDIEINGTLFVQDGVVLTVQAGAVVQGVKGSPDPAALIFLPGSKINAQGTSANPVVFTSNQAAGTRGKGDWAGVMFNGRSTVNRPNCLNNAEGIATAYGGCDAADSSGIARFVRVEYAGLDFTPNNELNLWTMNAIGSGTVFDFIQANVGDDDCLEWFGGTANHKFMVASGCGDDGLDWQLGWTGTVQYALMLQSKTLTDPTARDSRGIEADNSEFGNNDLPRSNPKLCNITLVSEDNAGDNAGSDAGILFRRGTAGVVANAVVTGFQDAGIELRDASTTQQACTDATTLSGNLSVRNSIFYGNGNSVGTGTEHCKRSNCVNGSNQTQHQLECTGAGVPFPCCTGAAAGNCLPCNVAADCGTAPYDNDCGISNAVCGSCEYYNLLVANNNVINANTSNATNPGQSRAYPTTGNLYAAKPTGTLPAATDCTQISDQFEATSYVGAFDPAGVGPNGWLTQPWISFDQN